MKISIIIPAYNEEDCIEKTISNLFTELTKNKITHEILVVNDNSTDGTIKKLHKLKKRIKTLRYISKGLPHGFGLTVKKGLENYSGDAAIIMMADGSDSPKDVVKYCHKLNDGFDCVFGSRFIAGSDVEGYPRLKFIFNRVTNMFIKILFGITYNDTSNAFKGYNRRTIDGIKPLFSYHFNLTVEMPLKAIIRGYNYCVVPISWKNRKKGISKLVIKEMGSRYLFIILYCFLEKILSRGDYMKREGFK